MNVIKLITLLFIANIAFAEYAGEWNQETALSKINKGEVVVLDVRSEGEYKDGHVPTAINIPHNELEKHLDELAQHKGKDILIYCRSGRRAGIAESKLTEHGFTNLYHLEGDMQGWKKSNLEIAK